MCFSCFLHPKRTESRLYGCQCHSSHQCLQFQCVPVAEKKVEQVALFLHRTVLEHGKMHQKRTGTH
ncbi:unnamed protein product [Staurois parvus]|uniref:Uncharacterized protein n=1 Tax=Staurois parvus TaxID=386267 RepID=A0ABN9CVF0_9NEOB|nr:unnamed protein product [Staurois parvus]